MAHVAGLDTHIGAVFLKKIFTAASHLVICLWDTLTAVDAPLFTLLTPLSIVRICSGIVADWPGGNPALA